MRLHELLVNAKDICTMVARHLDAESLFRLTMACKDSQKCVNQSEIVYACVLRTFPGIRNVPKGRECGYYWSAFEMYFSKTPSCFVEIMPHFELVTLIGISIKCDQLNTSDDDESGQDTVPMRIKVSVLLSDIQSQFRSLAGRRNIIKCAGDWRALVDLGESAIAYRYDACKLLDRIAYLAEHVFLWHDLQLMALIEV